MRAAGDAGRAIELTDGRARALHPAAATVTGRQRFATTSPTCSAPTGADAEAMEELKRAVAIFAEIGEPGKLEPEIWKLSEW